MTLKLNWQINTKAYKHSIIKYDQYYRRKGHLIYIFLFYKREINFCVALAFVHVGKADFGAVK